MPSQSEKVFRITKAYCMHSGTNPNLPRVGLHQTHYNWVNSRTTGENYKDWRQRKAEGRSVTTGLTGVRKTLTTWPVEYTYVDNGITIHIFGKYVFSMPDSVNESLQAQATAIAQQKFAKKANQFITTWQGGVAAGEFREAVRQLASPTKRLRSEVLNLLSQMLSLKRRYRHLGPQLRKDPAALEKAVSKETLRALSSLRKAVADTWLEWSFGVKPTISDCQDAYLALQKMSKGRRVDSLRFRATHKERSRRMLFPSVLTGLNVSAASGLVKVDCIEEYESEVTFRGAFVHRSPDGNLPIPDLFGVNLKDIAPTAWELIPWSFFVDYFTDVGSAIEACSIRLADFGWVNCTVRNRTSHITVNGRADDNPFVVQNYKPTFYCANAYIAKGSIYKVVRTAGFPPMAPYKPIFRIPGTETKWLNIAALMNGILTLKR